MEDEGEWSQEGSRVELRRQKWAQRRGSEPSWCWGICGKLLDKVVVKLKPRKEWRLDEEWGEQENVPECAVALKGMERGSLTCWEAQVSTPVREERRRSGPT